MMATLRMWENALMKTVQTLSKMKQAGEKIACLTCYDFSLARLLSDAGVDVLLVGDSVDMVAAGKASTLGATMEQMVYHTACVARGNAGALLVADMPFGSYEADNRGAFGNARRLIGDGGAHMVKVEGAAAAGCVEFLSARGILVCGHLGLTPQHLHRLGGYKTQAKGKAAAGKLLRDARRLQDCGAAMLVLECVPPPAAAQVAETLAIPVIGIGAGADCDGQILVLHDALGLYPGPSPAFAVNFMQRNNSIRGAVNDYVTSVKTGAFPPR